ncbi:Gp23 family protein [Listeria monocytogenes]
MYDGLTKVFDYALAKEMFFAALKPNRLIFYGG